MAQSGIVMVNGNPGTQPEPDPTPLPSGSGWSIAIDVIRELTRNAIGIFVVIMGLRMLAHFVEIATNKENIMLLVIGYLGGLINAAMLFYFGQAMRSALAQFQKDQGK